AVSSPDKTQISSSKKTNEVKFMRKLNGNPEYMETYTLYKNSDRFYKGTLSRNCVDGGANKVCTYTVNLDENCNLDKSINEYGSLITYDRQVCLNVLKAFEGSKISYSDLGPTDSKPNKDLTSKVLKMTKDREVALKTETGRDLHFPSYYSPLTLVRDCSMQINKENHYDGRVNVAKELTREWFHEISKNITGGVRR
ncbi:MAG: hypothetical protein J7501_06725, partial [Bdellovibrio sp.]|nr:hypothetical protein [Bdellovibrio sp.]